MHRRHGHEEQAATPLIQGRQHVLEAVRRWIVSGTKIVAGDHDDAHARAEVAAVDGRGVEDTMSGQDRWDSAWRCSESALESHGPAATRMRATAIKIGTIAANAPGNASSRSAPVQPPAPDAMPSGMNARAAGPTAPADSRSRR